MSDTFEVLEFAGLVNQTEIGIFPSLEKAQAYVDEHYTEQEIKELSVDITRNGSTEF